MGKAKSVSTGNTNGYAIRYVEPLPEKMQLAVLQHANYPIRYVKNLHKTAVIPPNRVVGSEV